MSDLLYVLIGFNAMWNVVISIIAIILYENYLKRKEVGR
jgi:Tfp pilus assembly major pilin PilA